MKVKIMGGLGNQLFIYSFGYAMYKELGAKELILDTENYDIYHGPEYMLNNFKIICNEKYIKSKVLFSYQKIYKLIKLIKIRMYNTKVYNEKELFVFDGEVYSQNENTLFIGYWQNYRYFEKYKKDIVEQFQLKKISNNLKYAIDKINSDAVAVHIRRGDYKTYLGGKCLDKSYYFKCLKQIYKRNENTVFYIFTDDPNYCKEILGDYNIEVVSEKYSFTDLEEFYYMSRFKHFVIANSTFSWWAAYISGVDDVFAPIVDMWTKDFYPSEWKGIVANIETV